MSSDTAGEVPAHGWISFSGGVRAFLPALSGCREAYAEAVDAILPDRIAAYKKAVAEARAAEG